MKKLSAFLLLSLSLVSCGGSAAPSFEGVWNGSFTRVQNNCPFTVASDINPLFPMTVSVDENDTFTVVAVDGSVAVGGQGKGETISFLAKSPSFGKYGTTGGYTCTSVQSEVGYLTEGDNTAKVTVTHTFTSCTTPNSNKKAFTCGAIYYGEATRS
jgi:hypothetical protein